MLDWIEAQRTELIEIYEKCKKEQPVLEAFSVYLLRILNGLSQMSGSQFYDYEVQILADAMRLFFVYYIEQVKKALSTEIKVKEKKDTIEDIEYAIRYQTYIRTLLTAPQILTAKCLQARPWKQIFMTCRRN